MLWTLEWIRFTSSRDEDVKENCVHKKIDFWSSLLVNPSLLKQSLKGKQKDIEFMFSANLWETAGTIGKYVTAHTHKHRSPKPVRFWMSWTVDIRKIAALNILGENNNLLLLLHALREVNYSDKIKSRYNNGILYYKVYIK